MNKTVTCDNAEAGPSTGPHHMRISSGGSIANYVKFALDFLETSPSRPLVLHTRPPTPSSTATSPSNQARSTSTLQPCTTNVPRMISVVELIKREFMAKLEKSKKGKGKHRAMGIWQYTRSGLVEPKELGLGLEAEGDGGMGLDRVLQGKLKPKMTHYPFLEVTLSSRPLGLEKERDTSCQYTLAPRPRPSRQKSGKDPADGTVDARDGMAEQAPAQAGDTGANIPEVGGQTNRELNTVAQSVGGPERILPDGAKKSKGKKRKVTSLGIGQDGKTKKAKAAE